MKKIMDGNEACSFVSYNFTDVAWASKPFATSSAIAFQGLL